MPHNIKKCCGDCVDGLVYPTSHCLMKDCPCHTSTPEKCEGICKHCPYYVNECPKDHEQKGGGNLPSIPAVEDWEERAQKSIDLFYGKKGKDCPVCGVNPKRWQETLTSLRESDRKRIVEGLNKMKRKIPTFLGDSPVRPSHDVTFNQGIESAITFITNLK